MKQIKNNNLVYESCGFVSRSRTKYLKTGYKKSKDSNKSTNFFLAQTTFSTKKTYIQITVPILKSREIDQSKKLFAFLWVASFRRNEFTYWEKKKFGWKTKTASGENENQVSTESKLKVNRKWSFCTFVFLCFFHNISLVECTLLRKTKIWVVEGFQAYLK